MTFRSMAPLLPAQSKGVAAIKHFEVTQKDAQWAAMRREDLSPGTYVRLEIGGRLMMSDTDMERRTNAEVVRNATGNVLIAGLGVGLIVLPILEKPSVYSVTVIEKYQDVIDLVLPSLRWHLKPSIHGKLLVHRGDIFEWKPRRGEKFDTIYFDIWPDICVDNLKQINTLHQRGKHWKSETGWMASWMQTELRRRRAQENRHRPFGGW